jgi:acyl-CoA synthetase (NDP forming)
MGLPAPLSRLVWPRSLAFIGGTEAEIALVKTRSLGFSGRLYAVNPRRSTLGGIACLPSVAELPEAPDAAFISVKREPTIAIVAELARRGSGGAVVYASGFAEVGGDGPELQAELVRAAGTMPIMGPNCYGYINFIARTSLWPDEYGGEPRDRGVAIITQSGNIAINFTMTRRGLPLAAIFTLGNQAGIDIAALLDVLADDERITAIGLHIEGLRDPAAFAAAMVKARNHRKPVIALKTGRSEQGARVTMSHTSSLAGSDALYDALFERHGVARVTTITQFVETLKFLHHGGALPGGRCVSMSCSGGEAALVADLALDRRLSFPPFAPETAAKIAATLNAYVAIDNPLDYHTFIWGDRDKLAATFAAVLAGGFDVGMLILDVPTAAGVNSAGWFLAIEAMIDAATRTGARSAVVATLPECLPETAADRLSASAIAPMAGLDDALAAFEAAATIGAAWARPAPPAKLSRPERLGQGEKPLTEYQAKMLLAAAGLDIPDGVIAAPLDAADAARRLGFPVVVKASSSALSHKTEAGGVAVNLTTPEEVRDSALRMRDLADEVLVEKMVMGAVCELIIGVKTDPQFGLALVIGAGGILTEFLKDAATLLLPTSREEIERALGRLRIAALIDGFRGRKGDRAAVIGAIEAVARFAEAHGPYIEELDINPLMVLPPGQGAVAVDALLRLRTGD